MSDKNFCNNDFMKCVSLAWNKSFCKYYKYELVYNDSKKKFKRCYMCIKECGEIIL